MTNSNKRDKISSDDVRKQTETAAVLKCIEADGLDIEQGCHKTVKAQRALAHKV